MPVTVYTRCCGQPWVWHIFFGKGLWWVVPTIKINRIGLKHHWGFNQLCGPLSDTLKEVPDFSRPSESDQVMWAKRVNTRGFPQVPTFGSIWVVLWLSFFRSAPSTFELQQVTLRGVCFRESLVYRLYSEIDQIDLSIEAQCGTACLLACPRIRQPAPISKHIVTFRDTLLFTFGWLPHQVCNWFEGPSRDCCTSWQATFGQRDWSK